MIIDAHAHLGAWPGWRVKVRSPQELVNLLKDEGIDYALTSSFKSILYDFREGNQELLEAAAKFPQIIPLLCLNPWYLEESLHDLDDCRQRGFVGIKLHPAYHNYRLDSAIAEPILERCATEGIPILTHSTEGDARCGSGNMRAAAEKHPDLILVIGHSAIFASPYAVEVAFDHPNVYLEISVNYEAGKLERTVERVGCDKLLFGSDVPLHHPSVMLQRIRVMGLSAQDEEKILWRNTARLFSLKL